MTNIGPVRTQNIIVMAPLLNKSEKGFFCSHAQYWSNENKEHFGPVTLIGPNETLNNLVMVQLLDQSEQ